MASPLAPILASPLQPLLSLSRPNAGGGLLPAPLLDLQAASDTGTIDDDDITSDTTPDFDAVFSGGMVAGDILRVFDGETELTEHEITPEEVSSGTVSLGLSGLSNGEHVIRARLERGTRVGQFGEIIITITTTPP